MIRLASQAAMASRIDAAAHSPGTTWRSGAGSDASLGAVECGQRPASCHRPIPRVAVAARTYAASSYGPGLPSSSREGASFFAGSTWHPTTIGRLAEPLLQIELDYPTELLTRPVS